MKLDQEKIISPSQCRAARALIDIDGAELAERAGVAPSTISSFENANSDPNPRTMRKICTALEQAGANFVEGDGVKRREQNHVRIIEGEDANLQIHDDIYHTLKDRGGEVLCAGVTELDESAGERFELLKRHIDRLQKAGITERILLKEGDTNLVAPREWYRWIPNAFFAKAPLQIYGNKIALKDLEQNQILLIEQPLFAESQRASFDALWNMAKLVDTGAIK